MKLLVIVSKPTEEYRSHFQFELRLSGKLRVGVHDPPVLERIRLLLAAGDCWRFEIKGPFRSELAKQALEDVQNAEDSKKIPSVIGLRAAVKPWVDAQTQYAFNLYKHLSDTHTYSLPGQPCSRHLLPRRLRSLHENTLGYFSECMYFDDFVLDTLRSHPILTRSKSYFVLCIDMWNVSPFLRFVPPKAQYCVRTYTLQ
jgi:hypothetical protein